MTKEEREEHRKLLCDALRNGHPSRSMCREAADELERTAPPRPDASAGLIEAAEIVYAKWDKLSDSDPKACGDMWELYNEIRARAADRSGK